MAVSGSVYRPNIDRVIDENNPFFGYVSTLERALEIVRDYELKTTTKFTVYKRTKDFGTAGKFTRANHANFKFSREMSNYCLIAPQGQNPRRHI